MKLDGYIRVSRVNGRSGDSFISPKVQKEAIERWAKAHGHEIAEDGWHEELDRSGGHGKKRPVFEKAIERVLNGQSKGIVVWKLSRFGRSLIESAVRISKIQDAGGVVESATEGEQSKLTRNIMLAIAEDELDRMSEGWAQARRLAIDRGVWIGIAPFGYLRNEEGSLEIDPVAGPIASEAYRIASAEGFQRAMRYLNREASHRRWRPGDVRRLLSSRAYLGESFSGKLRNADAHPPLTTVDRWAAVQVLPEMTCRPLRASGAYPLSGIARCGKCGGGMFGQLQTVRGVSRRRLRCGCGGGASITADGLEEYVKGRVGMALVGRDQRVRVDEGGLGPVKEKLDMARSDLQRWLGDERTRDSIGDELFHQGVDERAAKVKEAEREFAEMAGKAARSEWMFTHVELEDPEQYARAVNSMIRAVKVKPGRGTVIERVKIEWNEECLNVAAFNVAAFNPFYTSAAESTIEAGANALVQGYLPR